ncbi:MAG: hypothetical protein EOP47_26645 [Sphingobacteriaceae bacterium]|nr:MAG: hypothetical protein EOP47_26645 [Sphingobacteriaceae bacterium]
MIKPCSYTADKQYATAPVILSMTQPANRSDKPSPSDTPTDRPADNGDKSKIRPEDRHYQADEPGEEDIAKKHEREEQPVNPVVNPPAENGMEKGQVQPD